MIASKEADSRELKASSVDMEGELASARAETDRLFQLISRDDLYVRPLPQRHRLIFYVGHLEAFDWNQVGRMALGESHLHSTFDTLFERGIDPEPGQLPADQPGDWPTLKEVASYAENARKQVDRIFAEAPADFQQTIVEHRWMHAETIAYLLHNLPHEQKRDPGPKSREIARVAGGVKSAFIPIPAGRATLGRRQQQGFGWDNEFNECAVDVAAFRISRYKITNGEYLEYLEATGAGDGAAPHFWSRQDGAWFYRGMFELTPLPLDAPVYVTQHQAAAYAQWRALELPTEAQFHRAAYGTPDGAERDYPWDDGSFPTPGAAPGNFDFRHWDPVSVAQYRGGDSSFGVSQLVGNGWEWTRTPFGPFDGFAPKSNYPRYSADFFDDQHFVMKGASPRTAALLTRRSLRNWFRPDYPYVYATFHVVENE